MKRKDLINKLDRLGVSQGEYSLFIEEEEKYCLLKTEELYAFYYLEKRNNTKTKSKPLKDNTHKENSYKSLLKYFKSKEKAYDFFYDFFVNDKYSDSDWVFYNHATDGLKFLLKGLNIWEYKWGNTGKFVNIKHPSYEQSFFGEVTKIKTANFEIEFICYESSNGGYIIFLKKEEIEKIKKPWYYRLGWFTKKLKDLLIITPNP